VFLSELEVRELTGRHRWSAQSRVLDALRILKGGT
jgi:hypothetical protein